MICVWSTGERKIMVSLLQAIFNQLDEPGFVRRCPLHSKAGFQFSQFRDRQNGEVEFASSERFRLQLPKCELCDQFCLRAVGAHPPFGQLRFQYRHWKLSEPVDNVLLVRLQKVFVLRLYR